MASVKEFTQWMRTLFSPSRNMKVNNTRFSTGPQEPAIPAIDDDPWLHIIERALVGYTVGNGIQPIFGYKNTENNKATEPKLKAVAENLKNLFDDYAKKIIDPVNDLNFYGVQALLRTERFRTGLCCGVRQVVPTLGAFANAGVVVVPKDRVTRDVDAIGVTTGIKVSSADNPAITSLEIKTGYFYKFIRHRAGANSPVSEFGGVASLTYAIAELTEALANRQQLNATITRTILQDKDIEEAQEPDYKKEVDATDTQVLWPGAALANHRYPNVGNDLGFLTAQLKKLCIYCNIPYELVTGDMTDTSYSGGKIIVGIAYNRINTGYELIEYPIYNTIMEWFLDTLPDSVFQGMRDKITWFWQPPRKIIPDLDKEIRALKEGLTPGANGLPVLSPADVYASLGTSAGDMAREWAQALALFDQVLDTMRQGEAKPSGSGTVNEES